MTVAPTFPILPGQGIAVHKVPKWDTLVAQSASGRETRARRYRVPLWDFELTFDGLDSTSDGQYGGLGAETLQTLAGFFCAMQGQETTFLYIDPTDFSAVEATLGFGDGVTTDFPFIRSIGPYAGPVECLTGVPSVYLDGVAQGGGWLAAATPAVLTFSVAPALGVKIAASFTYAYMVRFSDDLQDFEEFMLYLHELKTIKFQTSRRPLPAPLAPFGPAIQLVQFNGGVFGIYRIGAWYPTTPFSYLLHSSWHCLPNPVQPGMGTDMSMGSLGSASIALRNSHGVDPTCTVILQQNYSHPVFYTAMFALPANCLWHIMVSVDCISQVVQVYCNDAACTQLSGGFVSALEMEDGGPQIYAIDIGAQSGIFPAVGEMWEDAPGSFVDLSDVLIRRKFIDSDLTPAYLGPNGELPFGASPAFYLRAPNAPGDLLNNYGTAGPFLLSPVVTLSYQIPGTCPAPSP